MNSSIDYFHKCAEKSSGISIPHNLAGFQLPKTDSAYIGFFPYLNLTSNAREYIGIKLNKTLIKNSAYKITLSISLANISQYSISNFGVYFSEKEPITYCNMVNSTLNCLTPQVVNSIRNYLDDTLAWQEFSGTFISQGGEGFITIGNFDLDEDVDYYVFNGDAEYSQSYYYIDDVSLVKLPDQDISMESITYTSKCYSDSSSIQLRFQNTGGRALDFTVDNVTFNIETSVNGNVLQNFDMELSDNLNNPVPNTALAPDSFMSLEIFPVDLSRLGEQHEIHITSAFDRDEVNTNNQVSTTITPTMELGELSVSPKIVCPGGEVLLQSINYLGEPTWQFYNGLAWGNLSPRGAKAIDYPMDSTYYRLQLCGQIHSDSILVQVPHIPEAEKYTDSICGEGDYSIQPDLPPGIDQVYWYRDSNSSQAFHSGLSYSSYFKNSQTFYIQTGMDSCISPTRTAVYLIVEDCPLGIPNVFTPNGDGVNDTFFFHNADRKKLQTQIFDRWGKEVVRWEGNNGWDGNDLAEGVYYYIVRERAGKTEKVHKGKVTLLK